MFESFIDIFLIDDLFIILFAVPRVLDILLRPLGTLLPALTIGRTK